MDRVSMLAPAPRRVSGALRLRLMFGGVWNVIGWAMTCFGMIFVWAFVANSELRTWGRFSGDVGVVSGFVTAVAATSMSENETAIQAVEFEYEVEGAKLSGTSYAVRGVPKVGGRVEVEYVAGDPGVARVRGMRSAPFSAAVAFVFVFPLIGVGFVAFGLRKGRNAVRLLERGEFARGRLVGRVATNTTVNNRRVFKLTFAFEDARGEAREATVRSHLLEALEDEETEALMYDPEREAAVLLDALPGRPEIDAEGGFATKSLGVTVAVLVLPTLAVVGNAAVYLFVR